MLDAAAVPACGSMVHMSYYCAYRCLGLFRLDAPNFSHIKLADRQLSAIELFNLDLSMKFSGHVERLRLGGTFDRGVN